MVKIKFKKKKVIGTVNFLGRPSSVRRSKPLRFKSKHTAPAFGAFVQIPRPTSVSLLYPSMNRPALKFYGDSDKDGVIDGFDCEPRNKFKQGPQHKKRKYPIKSGSVSEFLGIPNPGNKLSNKELIAINYREKGAKERKKLPDDFDVSEFGRSLSDEEFGREIELAEEEQENVRRAYSLENLSPIGRKMMGMSDEDEEEEAELRLANDEADEGPEDVMINYKKAVKRRGREWADKIYTPTKREGDRVLADDRL